MNIRLMELKDKLSKIDKEIDRQYNLKDSEMRTQTIELLNIESVGIRRSIDTLKAGGVE